MRGQPGFFDFEGPSLSTPELGALCENGWLSDYKHHELELVKARRESAPDHTIPRRPKTKPRRAASRYSNGEK